MSARVIARASRFWQQEEALSGAPSGVSISRMDRLCGMAVCVADQVLGPPGAGFGVDPARVGVALGTAHGCWRSDEAYYRGLLAAGGQLLGASPRLFVYTLPSSPAGEISIRHGLRGPGLSEVGGATAGLVALAEALSSLDEGQADAILLCAVDEVPAGLDGAAALLLGSGGEIQQVAEVFCPGDPERALREVLGVLGPGPLCRCDRETARVMSRIGVAAAIEVAELACSAAVASVHLLAQPVSAPTLVLCCDPSGQAAGCLVQPGVRVHA